MKRLMCVVMLLVVALNSAGCGAPGEMEQGKQGVLNRQEMRQGLEKGGHI